MGTLSRSDSTSGLQSTTTTTDLQLLPLAVPTYQPSQPTLSLPRGLTLRPLDHSDAPRLAALCNNPNIARNMFDVFPSPYTLDDAHSFIASAKDTRRAGGSLPEGPSVDDPKANALPRVHAICLQNQLIGVIGLDHFPANTNTRHGLHVGYWLGEAYWRKGIVSLVLEKMVKWIWEKFGWCVRIWTGVYGWNEGPSGGVLKKVGFVEEARKKCFVFKQGEWTDEISYVLFRPGFLDKVEKGLGTGKEDKVGQPENGNMGSMMKSAKLQTVERVEKSYGGLTLSF